MTSRSRTVHSPRAPTAPAGSQVQLTLQPKFQTFTPAQFSDALRAQGFMMTQATAVNHALGQPVQIQAFSKGDMIVFLASGPAPGPQSVVFQVLNTIDLTVKKDGVATNDTIQELLNGLNITPAVTARIELTCTLALAGRLPPRAGLTSCVKPGVARGVAAAFRTEALSVTSIRWGTDFPLTHNGFQIVVEPLATNASGQYFINIMLQTDDPARFAEFVGSFTEETVRKLLDAVESKV